MKSSGRSQRKERGSGYGGGRGCSLESHVTDWRKCVDDYLSEHANMPADAGARGDSPTICRRMRPSLLRFSLSSSPQLFRNSVRGEPRLASPLPRTETDRGGHGHGGRPLSSLHALPIFGIGLLIRTERRSEPKVERPRSQGLLWD